MNGKIGQLGSSRHLCGAKWSAVVVLILTFFSFNMGLMCEVHAQEKRGGFGAVRQALHDPVAPKPPPKINSLYTTYGGWVLTGGTLAFAGLAAGATFAIEAIRKPPEGVDCTIMPEKCQLDTWGFIWTMSVLAGVVAFTGLAGWGSGLLARKLNAPSRVGWGIAGGLEGLPLGALIGFSIPEFAPNWLYFSTVSLVTAGTMVGTGFYLDWVAHKRGHAWPEFGIGIVAALAGSTVGSLICGERPCNATFIMGALGGIAGIGFATLLWRFPKEGDRKVDASRSPLQRGGDTEFFVPSMSYELAF